MQQKKKSQLRMVDFFSVHYFTLNLLNFFAVSEWNLFQSVYLITNNTQLVWSNHAIRTIPFLWNWVHRVSQRIVWVVLKRHPCSGIPFGVLLGKPFLAYALRRSSWPFRSFTNRMSVRNPQMINTNTSEWLYRKLERNLTHHPAPHSHWGHCLDFWMLPEEQDTSHKKKQIVYMWVCEEDTPTGMTRGLLDRRSREVTCRVWSSVHLTSSVSSTEHSGQKSSHVQS